MKVVLAGAYGHLGGDIFCALLEAGHEVVAADVIERDMDLQGTYTFKKLDVTHPDALKGLCDGADVVISTVGLTKASATVTNYDIDYQGNVNLLNEAKRAGVKKFIYISVLHTDIAPNVPILHAKFMMEEALKKSGMPYLIYRPSGYFYDIIHVFKPMIEKGTVSLLGKKPVSANVIDTPDFADYIVKHLDDTNKTVGIGGKETYTYEEIAKLCFAAAGKPAVIKRAPGFLFNVLAFVNKLKRNGKAGVIMFGKVTLTHDMVSEVKYGDHSFAEYIKQSFTK
jgi:uncharacterized protein YbjT (DUF2867 family)